MAVVSLHRQCLIDSVCLIQVETKGHGLIEAICAILNSRDVFVCLQTDYGKSDCEHTSKSAAVWKN